MKSTHLLKIIKYADWELFTSSGNSSLDILLYVTVLKPTIFDIWLWSIDNARQIQTVLT